MSQPLLLSLWVDPSRADRIGARAPSRLEPRTEETLRPWVAGRWRAAFADRPDAPAVPSSEQLKAPAARVPEQRDGASTDDSTTVSTRP